MTILLHIVYCMSSHTSTTLTSDDPSLSSETSHEQVTSVKDLVSSTELSSFVTSEMVSVSTGQPEVGDSITQRWDTAPHTLLLCTYNFHTSAFVCGFSLVNCYEVLVNDSQKRNYGLLLFEMPPTHPKITFASQMRVLFLCVGLFCVDLLRSYYYWQSLALHAHHAPVWPGSHRRPCLHTDGVYVPMLHWEQLHPKKNKKRKKLNNLLKIFSFLLGQDPAVCSHKRKTWGRTCGRHSRHEWFAGQFEEAEETNGETCCVCNAASHFFHFPFCVSLTL